jgi:hypothetical protein
LLAQRKRTKRKGTRLSRPPLADILRVSLLSGRKKTRCAQTVFTSFSANCCDAQRERMGYSKKIVLKSPSSLCRAFQK